MRVFATGSVVIIALLLLYLWQRAPEETISSVPPFFQGTWRNLTTRADNDPLTITSYGLSGYQTRKLTQKKNSPTLYIYTGSRIIELTPKGDDVVHIGETIATGVDDNSSYFELGLFARKH